MGSFFVHIGSIESLPANGLLAATYSHRVLNTQYECVRLAFSMGSRRQKVKKKLEQQIVGVM